MAKFMIEIKFKLPVEIHQKRKWYLASCCPLDVHSQGETEKEALKNIEEALRLFFTSCLERGTFDEVMRECGITVEETFHPKPPKSQRYIDVQVPIHLLANQKRRCECRA